MKGPASGKEAALPTMRHPITRRTFFQATAAAAASPVLGRSAPRLEARQGPGAQPARFLLTATVAFPDDCSQVVFTPALLGQLMERMQGIGVRRIYWEYYGDRHTGSWVPIIHRRAQGGATGVEVEGNPTLQTLLNFGEPPIFVAARIARRLGLEFYAIIKPYETGHSSAEPLGSPRAREMVGLPRIGGIADMLHPWTLRHPELRLRARQAGLPPNLEGIPVERIQLRKADDSPTRLQPQHLEIWASPDNFQYRRQEVRFRLRESVERCERDVREINGRLITRRGSPVRALTLEGLRLTDPFIALATNVEDDRPDFRNTAIEMIRAFGPDGEQLPIVVASHRATWRRVRDFRTFGLEFDGGLGDILVSLDVDNRNPTCVTCQAAGRVDCIPQALQPEFPLCRDGVIAFARGRNEYVSGALCEAYPQVQDLWLGWIGECVAAGVDGLDIRISNHSTWSDNMDLYGFNEPVIAEYKRRYGVDPDTEPYDPKLLAALRGEFYDHFLTRARRKLAAAGKKMQLHIEVESFRPGAPQLRERTRPGNTDFRWRHWIDSGLAYEATLMTVAWSPERALQDELVREVLSRCRARGVPIYLRNFMWNSRDGSFQADQLELAYRHGSFSGYNYYETASFYDFQKTASQGELVFFPGLLEALRERARHLGLL